MANNPELEPFDIEAFKNGDRGAIAYIFDKYWKMVSLRPSSILQDENDAKEVVNDTFREVFDRKKQYESEEHIKNSLRLIAINKSINRLKARSGSDNLLSTDPFELEYLTEVQPEVSDQELIDQILLESEKLNPPQKTTLLYYYIEELPVKDIARLMNVNEKTVYYRLGRAEKIIRKALKNKGFRIFLLTILFCLLIS